MRVLKFRAFDKTNQIWINGTNKNGFHIIGEHTMFDILNQYKLENICDIEVSQFTGMKDFFGNDIYEGDLLFSENGKLMFEYKVFFYEASFCYAKAKRGIKRRLLSKEIYFKQLKVIGNIYSGLEKI